MKIKKNSPLIKKLPLVLTVIAIFALASGVVYAYTQFSTPKSEQEFTDTTEDGIDYNPPTEEQIQTGTDIKQETSDRENETPAPANSLAVSITSTGENQGELHVGVLISSLLSSGTCSLKLTNQSTTITKTSNIMSANSYSSCSSFGITYSDLAAGQWTAGVTVTSGNASGSASSTFEVR